MLNGTRRLTDMLSQLGCMGGAPTAHASVDVKTLFDNGVFNEASDTRWQGNRRQGQGRTAIDRIRTLCVCHYAVLC